MKTQDIKYTVDLLQAMLWQYNQATSLNSLATQEQAWYTVNQSSFWEVWFQYGFNLQTANQFGLTLWSIILEVPLYVNTSEPTPGAPLYGFNENLIFPALLNNYLNFENGNFSNIGSQIILTEEQQRFVLRLRYFDLITRGALPEINEFLDYLYGSTTGFTTELGWALDGLDMTMTYIFNYQVPEVMRTVFRQIDLLPRPAGVGLKYYILTDTIFGFNEATPINTYQNYFNANFIPAF